MARLNPDNAIRVVKDSPNLRELTTQALRNAILGMHFKPKERLVERRLCEQTGVSRTCVREALQHLESEGLVERVPNRGLFVATVSRDEARHIPGNGRHCGGCRCRPVRSNHPIFGSDSTTGR